MSSRTAFVERLGAIAEMVGSVNALAKKAGVSQTGLRNYLLHSEPTRPVIEAIANAAGVSPEWLSYGRAPMCEPGSSVPIRAREELERICRARWPQDPGTAIDFVSRLRTGEFDEEVPAWIRFALADACETEPPHAAQLAGKQRLDESELDEDSSALILLRLVPELSPWIARASSTPDSLLNVGRAGNSALKQLQTTMRINGQRPSSSTVRTVVESHIHRADPKLWLEKEGSESEQAA